MIDFLNDPVVRRELTVAVTFALQAALAMSVAVPVSLAIIRKLSRAVHR
jgi:hypothetical protein